VVVPITLLYTNGLSVTRLDIRLGHNTFTLSIFQQMVELVLGGSALLLIAVVLYVVSFASLRSVQKGFTGPMVAAVIGVLGLLLILYGLGSYLSQLVSASACPQNADLSTCVNFTSIYTAVIAVIVGLLLAFVGWIGVILGLYRIGKRYGTGLARAGAILYIIPLLNIIAPILVLVGVSRIRLDAPPPAAPA
jgi:hypothetical protein